MDTLRISRITLATIASTLFATLPVVAGALTIADVRIDPRRAGEVKIEFAAGELRVISTDGDRIRAELIGRCERNYDDCRDKADRIQVVSQYTGDAVWLRLTGVSKFNPNGPKLTLRVEVPRELAVGIDMAAGDLDVHGVERDLAIDMSAGDIHVEMPERHVRSVTIQVSVGDATLDRQGRIDGGEGWLGKRIDWDRGPGDARVRVKLRAGDASVRLR